MRAAEVVEGDVQANRAEVLLEIPAESVGQARDPTNAHAHREIGALDVGGRDLLGVRAADDLAGRGSGADCRAVTNRGALRGRAVVLDQLREVDSLSEGILDGRCVTALWLPRDILFLSSLGEYSIYIRRGRKPYMPVIYSTPALAPEEETVVRLVDELKRRIRSATGSDGERRRWEGLLRRNLFAKAIVGSNSIEGIHASVEDAIAAVEGEEPLDERTKDWRAITGYRRAMTYVLRLRDDPHFTYSAELLKSLHFMMLEHEADRNPGRWRPGAVYVIRDSGETVYQGPDSELVPELVGALIQDLNRSGDSPGIVRAAMAHLNLVMVHPFSDGNGRMARCLQSLVLARTGMVSPVFSSIEEYLGRNTLPYYAVLEEVGQGTWHPENDARPWLRFCLSAHYIQASTVLRRIKETHLLWEEIDREVQLRGLPERSIVALLDAALGFKVRNATYRGPAGVSQQTASIDLSELAKSGLLVPYGEKRGRYYLRGELLSGLRSRTRSKVAIANPFDNLEEAQRLAVGPEPAKSAEQTLLFPSS
jgi:Fic family protein